jgi:hypothetical protein
MNKTGDKLIDTIVRNFREIVRPLIQRGSGVDFEKCLEKSVLRTRYDLRKDGYSEKLFFEHIWPEEDSIRRKCRKVILEIEKRYSLMEIRKTSIRAILDDFSANSVFSFSYRLRDNNTVGFSVKIPATGQYLMFSASYSKVLSEDWRAGTVKDIQAFLDISGRLGRIKVSPNCG